MLISNGSGGEGVASHRNHGGGVERCDGRGDLTSRVVLGRHAVEISFRRHQGLEHPLKMRILATAVVPRGWNSSYLESAAVGPARERPLSWRVIGKASLCEESQFNTLSSISHHVVFFLSCFTGWVVLRWKSEAGRYRRRND